MTRQVTHTCDVCGEMFFVPENQLRTLEINWGQTDEIVYDLCFDCHRELLDWIVKKRESK